MNIRDISITHHGRRISGTMYLPEETTYPMVIFSHGFNGSGDNFKYQAEMLAENGIGAFTYDFCGGSLKSKSSMPTTEMTMFTEKEDLVSVLDTVKILDGVDKNNIFLFGASMGGLVTALVAEENEKYIKGMMLLYPAFCVADDWNKHFKNIKNIPDIHNVWNVPLGRCFFEVLRGFNIFDNIGKYQKNVLIMHGDEDKVVPLKYSQTAHTLYSHSNLEIFTGEGHGFSSCGDKQMTNRLFNFVKQNID